VELLFISLALAGCALGLWSHCLEIGDAAALRREEEELGGKDSGWDDGELMLPGELGESGGGDFMLLADTEEEEEEDDGIGHGLGHGHDGSPWHSGGKRGDDELDAGLEGDAVRIGSAREQGGHGYRRHTVSSNARPPVHPAAGGSRRRSSSRRSSQSQERSPSLRMRQASSTLGDTINRASAHSRSATASNEE